MGAATLGAARSDRLILPRGGWIVGILEADYETTGRAAHGNAPPGARVLDITLVRARVTNAQRSAPPVIGPNDARPIVQATLPSFVDFGLADRRVHALTLHDVHVVGYRAEALVDELIRARGVLRGCIYARISAKPWSWFRILCWLLALLMLLALLVLFATCSVTQPIIGAACDRARLGAETVRDRWRERGAVDDDARLVAEASKGVVATNSARGGSTAVSHEAAGARRDLPGTGDAGAPGAGANAMSANRTEASDAAGGDHGMSAAANAPGADGSDGASASSADPNSADPQGAGANGAGVSVAGASGAAKSDASERGAGTGVSGAGASSAGARGASANRPGPDVRGAGANAASATPGADSAGDLDGGRNPHSDDGALGTRRYSVDEALERPAHFFGQCGQPLYLSGDLLFDSDNDELRASSTPLLLRLARLLGEAADPQRVLHVIGHADETGGLGYNDALSERRARRVADWLVDHGSKNQAIVVQGRGQREPVVPRGSPQELQRLNRRVEVMVQCQ
jgi:outer membrane protein OmpA-like peptidoglycan-associated protein